MTLLQFLLHSSIAFTVLFLTFWLFFKNLTFHKLNRFVLLGIIGLSTISPLIQIQFPSSTPITTIPKLSNDIVNKAPNKLREYPPTSNESLDHLIELTILHTSGISSNQPNLLLSAIPIIYVSGLAVFLSILILRFLSISRIILRSAPKTWNGINYRESEDIQAPCSFFGFILFPSSQLDHGNHNIFYHELAHRNELHSLDLLIAELFKTIYWFNPLAWICKNQIQLINEYRADEVTSTKTDKTQYQYGVLGLRNIPAVAFSNSFHHQIKKRILMMNRPISNTRYKYLYLTLLLLAPALFVSTQDQAFEPAGIDTTIKVDIDQVQPYFDAKEYRFIELAVPRDLTVKYFTTIKYIKNKFYILDRGHNRLLCFSNKGKYLFHINIPLSKNGQNTVQDFCYDSQTSTLLVMNRVSIESQDHVIRYALDGKRLTSYHTFYGFRAIQPLADFYVMINGTNRQPEFNHAIYYVDREFTTGISEIARGGHYVVTHITGPTAMGSRGFSPITNQEYVYYTGGYGPIHRIWKDGSFELFAIPDFGPATVTERDILMKNGFDLVEELHKGTAVSYSNFCELEKEFLMTYNYKNEYRIAHIDKNSGVSTSATHIRLGEKEMVPINWHTSFLEYTHLTKEMVTPLQGNGKTVLAIFEL